MPPKGYLDYCLRTPNECRTHEEGALTPAIPLTAKRWAELGRVNTLVNASVRYVTDQHLYDRGEFWTYPDGRGDCEDYALLKRKHLLEKGWPAETLLMGVALDLDGLRHAVLIAVTDQGDFVLDNQLEQVVAWSETGYTWEKRQTAANPNIWVALTGLAAAPAAPLTLPSSQTIATASPNWSPTASEAAKTPIQDDTENSLKRPLPQMRPAVGSDNLAEIEDLAAQEKTAAADGPTKHTTGASGA